MSPDTKGQLFALFAAMNWACALVLFKRSGEKIPPLALNLFKNVVALLLLAATLPFLAEDFDQVRDLPPRDMWLLLISGVLGIAVADSLIFYSLNYVGVGIMAIVECTYSPFIILFAVLMLGERLTLAHLIGGGLILTGVLICSKHPPPEGKTPRQVLWGVLLGTAGLASMGFGIVMIKPILERMPLVWATTLRLASGTLALAAYMAVVPAHRKTFAVFRPSKIWKFAVPASILGSYIAMIFWVGGFKYTASSSAAVLNQTATVFSMILATLVLKERLTARKLAAVTLALLGVMTVTLLGHLFE